MLLQNDSAVVLTWGSCNMIGSFGTESLVLFFLFLRLVFGVVATIPRFFPKAVVKVVEVADMPMVVVVVALGGSIGTSFSEGEIRSNQNQIIIYVNQNKQKLIILLIRFW